MAWQELQGSVCTERLQVSRSKLQGSHTEAQAPMQDRSRPGGAAGATHWAARRLLARAASAHPDSA